MAEAEREREEYRRTTGNRFYSKLATNQLTPADVMQSGLDALGHGGKQEWLEQIQKGAFGPTVTNPQVYVALFNRIHLPDNDPNKIGDASELNQFLGSGLTMSDLGQLRKEVEGVGTPEGQRRKELRQSLLKTARGQISGTNDLMGMRDPKGEALYQQWLAETLAEETEQREKGHLDADSYNPVSPKFLGRTTGRYQRSPVKMLADITASVAGKDERDTEDTIATRATKKAHNAKTGQWIYLVDGKWVSGDGSPVK